MTTRFSKSDRPYDLDERKRPTSFADSADQINALNMTNKIKKTVKKSKDVANCRFLLSIILAVNVGVVAANVSNRNKFDKNESLLFVSKDLGDVQRLGDLKNVKYKWISKDVCYTPGCRHAASEILKNMDPMVDPCDDFYKFACGGFLKSTTISNDQTNVDAFSKINDNLLEQVRTILEEEIPGEFRVFKLAKDLYRSCMNMTAIESQGFEPLFKIYRVLGGWPVLEGNDWPEEGFDWKESVYKLRELKFTTGYFIKFGIVVDFKNNTRRMILLDQPKFGIPREYLIQGFDNEFVQNYYKYMVDIAVIFGANKERAENELKESLEFEMKLANISYPDEERNSFSLLYNPIKIRELSKNYPRIPWLDYINRILSPIDRVDEDEVVNFVAPKYISQLEELLNTTRKKVLANFVMWAATQETVGFFSEQFRKRQLIYFDITEEEDRWKKCVDIVSSWLFNSVGSLYVRKYFDEETKTKVQEMVTNIKEQFNITLSKVDWMDNKTRMNALEKLTSMDVHIGYPDELLDNTKLEEHYKNLSITEDNFFDNMLNINILYDNYILSNLRKPVNKTNWVSHSKVTVHNAFYNSQENSIQFPAGILQGTFFSNDRPHYLNYGAIGSFIGNLITHGFDDKGRQFDKDGNVINWWILETEKNYLRRIQCVIDQYSNYRVEEVGLNLNGSKTQNEDIADNNGIKEAYLAYKEWMKRNGREKRLPHLPYTPEQMFWISAANSWCGKERLQDIEYRITMGQQSPGEFRVIGPISNMDQFSKDFNCKLGAKMNPEKKCTIW